MREKKPPFKVGDKVTSRFYPGQEAIVRTVLSVEEAQSSSGWVVAVSDGEPCPTCHRRGQEILRPVDSLWFQRVKP